VGDAYALTDSVNVTLFMVRNERTNKLFFKTVVEQIKEDNIPIYIVLNDVDFKKGEYLGYLGYVKNSYSYYSKEDSYYTDAESTT
jgi:GTPase Era involved in 16S rRNA processing